MSFVIKKKIKVELKKRSLNIYNWSIRDLLIECYKFVGVVDIKICECCLLFIVILILFNKKVLCKVCI